MFHIESIIEQLGIDHDGALEYEYITSKGKYQGIRITRAWDGDNNEITKTPSKVWRPFPLHIYRQIIKAIEASFEAMLDEAHDKYLGRY